MAVRAEVLAVVEAVAAAIEADGTTAAVAGGSAASAAAELARVEEGTSTPAVLVWAAEETGTWAHRCATSLVPVPVPE